MHPDAMNMPLAKMKRFFAPCLLALIIVTATACPLDDIFEEPQILSMTVTPSSLPRSEIGMTDEFFTVVLSLINFDEEIENVSVFIQDPYRDAVPQEILIGPRGDEVELRGIAKTWFTGFTPGTYQIGALIETETVSVRENNLATVTVTD